MLVYKLVLFPTGLCDGWASAHESQSVEGKWGMYQVERDGAYVAYVCPGVQGLLREEGRD
jgi:hypothetical protein